MSGRARVLDSPPMSGLGRRWLWALCVGALVVVAGSRVAEAQMVDKWRVSEVVTALDGDVGKQYIELIHPGGGCFFSSSRIEVFYSDGQLLATQFPWAATVCPPGRTYTIATAAAAMRLGFPADRTLIISLPRAAAQVCFRSSSIRYDCVRWGGIPPAGVVGDFSGMTDVTSAVAPPSDFSITRFQDTDVVSADFTTYGPTPGSVNPIGRNDGGVLVGPDAGAIPDANLPDVYIPDARPPVVDARMADVTPLFDTGILDPADAGPDSRRIEQPYVPDFDAAGGCGCETGGRDGRIPEGVLALGLIAAALVVARRRSRR